MTTATVQRLNAGARAALTEHFLGLPADDLRLRFGSWRSAESIAAYVDGIDFDRDAAFGVHDDRLALVGAAHLVLEGDVAELGLSVPPATRGRGVGSALFERATAHARNRFIPRLFMHCLRENGAIIHLARKYRMSIVIDAGDADAYLDLPPVSPASIADEFVTDNLARYDYALKAHVAAWRRLNEVLDGTAHAAG